MAADSPVVEDEAAIVTIREENDFDCNKPNFISDEEINLAKSNITLLPMHVQSSLKELDTAYQEGEVTEKGFNKKITSLLMPHLAKVQAAMKNHDEEFFEPPLNSLPTYIIEQLDELERELKDEEITAKGYKRKREKILSPFLLKEPPLTTLPNSVLKDLEEILNEFKDGDITEKGYRKRRTKIIAPYLVKANVCATTLYTDGKKDDMLATMPNGNKKPISRSNSPMGIQIMNGNEKLFKCQLCDEVFKQAQSFSGHCRLHRHVKAKAFKCNVCKASYTTRSHLKFHMYKHSGNYPYSCEFCGKGFAGRSQYRYHVLRHSGQSPYICKECGGRFWKKRNLEVHCEKHRCDDAPAGLQKCAHCHAMFEELEELQAHLYEHDDGTEQEASMVAKRTISDLESFPDKNGSLDVNTEHADFSEVESEKDSGAENNNNNNDIIETS